MQAIKHYSCRYILPETKVFAIIRKNHNVNVPLCKSEILSTDFNSQFVKTPTRVIVGVCTQDIMKHVCPDMEYNVLQTSSRELAYVASLMNMPVVILTDVILNKDDIHFEIHYVSHK